MMRVVRLTCIAFALLLTGAAAAQKSKVQAAWRHLTDYEETWKEGKPDASYLQKAAAAIDQALANEATSKQAKTHAYKLRVSYAFHQLKLNEEIKRLEPTIQDKNERVLTAYSTLPLEDFESAVEQVRLIRELDPKYFESLQKAIAKGDASLDDDDLKLANAIQQMKVEYANIATGRYKVKKYDEAALYFYRAAAVNSMLSGVRDTANYTNAVIAAAKAKNDDLIIDYAGKAMEAGVVSPGNCEMLYNAYSNKGDTAKAMAVLRKGRQQFPANINLLTLETNYFLSKGRSKEALANIQSALKTDPSNGFLTLFAGNLYDNMANPKDAGGKELPKPQNFEELFRNAEAHYTKAIELNARNKEYLYNALFDLGAMYNNYGGYLSTRKAEKITDLVKQQKENDAAALVYFQKAIPYLEQALAIKDDVQCMKALRLLYMKTGNETKAAEMNARIKK